MGKGCAREGRERLQQATGCGLERGEGDLPAAIGEPGTRSLPPPAARMSRVNSSNPCRPSAPALVKVVTIVQIYYNCNLASTAALCKHRHANVADVMTRLQYTLCSATSHSTHSAMHTLTVHTAVHTLQLSRIRTDGHYGRIHLDSLISRSKTRRPLRQSQRPGDPYVRYKDPETLTSDSKTRRSLR